MPPGAGPLYLLGLLLAVPFLLLRDLLRVVARLLRWRAHWTSVSLQNKSRFRSTAGTFVVVLVTGAALKGLIPLNNPWRRG